SICIAVLTILCIPPISTFFPYSTLFRSHSIFEQVLLAKSFMFVVDNVQGSQTSLVLLLLSSFILFHFTKGQLNEHTRDKYMYKRSEEHTSEIQSRFDLVL